MPSFFMCPQSQTERQREEKMKQLDLQERANEEGYRKTAEREAEVAAQGKERFARDMFSMTLTDKQRMGLSRMTMHSKMYLDREYKAVAKDHLCNCCGCTFYIPPGATTEHWCEPYSMVDEIPWNIRLKTLWWKIRGGRTHCSWRRVFIWVFKNRRDWCGPYSSTRRAPIRSEGFGR